MEFLTSLRTWLHHRWLTGKLSSEPSSHYALSMSKIQSVGILFESVSNKDIQTATDFKYVLETMGKNVEMLAFRPVVKNTPDPPCPFFSKKDLNLIFIPGSNAAEKFRSTAFDLLISLSVGPCLPLEYLASRSAAKFRVGRFIPEKTYCFDMMIHLREPSVGLLIRDIEHYLNIIQPNEQTA